MAGYNLTVMGPAQSGKKSLCAKLNQYGFTATVAGNVAQTDAVILVLDVTNPDSVAQLPTFRAQIDARYGLEVPVILCGNKCDSKFRKVLPSKLVNRNNPAFDKHLGCLYFEVSARSGYHLLDVKHALTALIEGRAAPDREVRLVGGGPAP